MIGRCKVILLALVILLSGCAEKGVIPPKKMTSIIYDMYLLDAQVENSVDYSIMADTSSVYGALFDEYGYTVDEFNSSMDYYLHNPVQFKEIFNAVLERFEKEAGPQDLDPMALDPMQIIPDEPEKPEKKVRRGRLRKTADPPVNSEIEQNNQ